ncbi:unnamed protein product, partial [Mesorhabditis spiculigera]
MVGNTAGDDINVAGELFESAQLIYIYMLAVGTVFSLIGFGIAYHNYCAAAFGVMRPLYRINEKLTIGEKVIVLKTFPTDTLQRLQVPNIEQK